MDRLEGDILILDDDAPTRELLFAILKRTYRVHTAGEVTEALAILENNKIDVITLDVMMPRIKGPDAIKYLRGVQPAVEIVLVTGFASVSSAVSALREGVSDYILKPFRSVDLLCAVQLAVKRKRSLDSIVSILANAEKGGADRSAIERAVDFVGNRKWLFGRGVLCALPLQFLIPQSCIIQNLLELI